MDPMELLKTNYDNLTKAEQKVADYVLRQPQSMLNMTLARLAQASGTSNAAVIRLSQKIGYDGFSEFKFSMNRYLLSHGAETAPAEQDSTRYILDTYMRYINQIPAFVPQETLRLLAGKILTARRLDIWGVNRTAQSARQLSNRLQRLGIYNKVTDDGIVMLDDSNILEKGDVCILFTLNGRGRPDYAQMLADLQARGCYVILVTMNDRLKMVQYADETVVLPWISHDARTNFFEDQIIVYLFIELLLYEVVKLSPPLNGPQAKAE